MTLGAGPAPWERARGRARSARRSAARPRSRTSTRRSRAARRGAGSPRGPGARSRRRSTRRSTARWGISDALGRARSSPRCRRRRRGWRRGGPPQWRRGPLSVARAARTRSSTRFGPACGGHRRRDSWAITHRRVRVRQHEGDAILRVPGLERQIGPARLQDPEDRDHGVEERSRHTATTASGPTPSLRSRWASWLESRSSSP